MLLSRSFSWALFLVAASYVEVAFAKYAIGGVKTGVRADGYRPPRRDILELMKDEPQFSLYIQALNALMAVDEATLTSYFQIAGIHGRPYIAWDDVNPKQMGVDGIPIGYCTHGNILFGTWHRPYLALYEQLLAQFAQTTAKAYNSPTYQTAADNLRMPFWDWAASGKQAYPAVMTWPTIRITTATGIRNVTNPLYRYDFHSFPEREAWFPSTDSESRYLGRQRSTLRWPDNQNVTHNELVNARLAADNNPALLRQLVWAVFAQTTDFNSMSTMGSPRPSFENPHGNIHVYVGGNGHMSSVAYSAFDPTFWLHHANVDRQIAMWQAIYPNAWLASAQGGGGTWTIYPGSRVDQNTPLTPFTTGDGRTPYTSVSARFTKNFGYSYPDVQDWLFSDPNALATNVTRRVNQLYNPDGSLGSWGRSTAVPRRSLMTKRTESRAWSVQIKVPNGAVGTAFTVKLAVQGASIGELNILAAPTQAELDTGVKRVSYGEYTLIEALKDIDSTDIPAVVSHLKGALSWQVIGADGNVVEDVKELEVEVADQVVTLAQDDTEFPTYGERTVHPEVTA